MIDTNKIMNEKPRDSVSGLNFCMSGVIMNSAFSGSYKS